MLVRLAITCDDITKKEKLFDQNHKTIYNLWLSRGCDVLCDIPKFAGSISVTCAYVAAGTLRAKIVCKLL